MQHLNLEELARLVDEAASDEERRHLAGCEPCRLEMEAMQEQTESLGRLPDLPVPGHAWEWLEVRLAGEGLLRDRSAPLPLGWRQSRTLRAAAALLLFAAGAATGWSASVGRGAAGVDRGVLAAAAGDAEAALRGAEAAYLAALTRYAEETGAMESTDPVNQLATLEGIVLTTRAALEQSPADPVINGYHLAALGQREALLRRIRRSTESEWF